MKFINNSHLLNAVRKLIVGNVDVIETNISGVTSLKNIDSIDSTTQSTIETAINNFVVKDGNATEIKLLPRDFIQNEDGGFNKSIQYVDDTTIGVRASDGGSELYAFVSIPTGKTATSVIIYGSDTGNTVEVFLANVNEGALTDKTPGGGCAVNSACNMDDVASDSTNYLAIKVNVTATSDIIYGGVLTIS